MAAPLGAVVEVVVAASLVEVESSAVEVVTSSEVEAVDESSVTVEEAVAEENDAVDDASTETVEPDGRQTAASTPKTAKAVAANSATRPGRAMTGDDRQRKG